MPAHSENFPWASYYGHFKFFEKQMDGHRFVLSWSTDPDHQYVYDLELKNGNKLRVFACECYSFGSVELDETLDAVGHVDLILINGNWCGYTLEAKRDAQQKKIGVYNIGDLMRALPRKEPWTYLSADETEKFKAKGWL